MSPRGKSGKTPSTKSNFVMRLVLLIARRLLKYPVIFGGGSAFAIVFGFIASNALFYQKGIHPAPVLNMRGAHDTISTSTRIIEPVRNVQSSYSKVTTLKINPGNAIQTSSAKIPLPVPDRFAMLHTVTSQEGQANASISEMIKGMDLVWKIQSELAKQGYYTNDIDGLMGPRTSRAIRVFQKKTDIVVDGRASAELLVLLKKIITSGQGENVSSSQRVGVRTSVREQVSTPSEFVRQIQIGLSQSAYPDIEIDGIAGQRTREAIAQFEKHYRLPVTSLPNQQVLDKLKSIGAF